MESDSERETVRSSAVVVGCNEHKVNPVTFEWKWGEDGGPIADQYTYLGRRYLEKNALGMHTQQK